MKTASIYYSFSGNTKKVAAILSGLLLEKGPVEQIELQALDESRAFLGQCARAIKHTKGEIAAVNFDLSSFDLIFFGTPVWAFGPAPAMNTYLDKCTGVAGKEVILFSTYGSGAGKERCLNYMQEILSKKGAQQFSRFHIQQFKVKDKDFIVSEIKKIMRLWPNG